MKVAFSLPSLAVCAAVSGIFLLAPSPAQACPSEPFLGTICTLGTNYCPQGFLPAEGQILQINSYAALYSLLGTAYGGDGKSTFGLPDLRGRMPIAAGPGFDAPYPRGYVFGNQMVTLTEKNLPQHTHAATFTPGASQLTANLVVQVSGAVPANGSASPSTATPYMAANNGNAKMWAAAPQTNLTTISGVSANLPGGMTGSVTNAAAGASAPVPVLPPATVMAYCISATNGVYPPRD